MLPSMLRALVPGVVLPVMMGHAGGWAVITIDEVPEYAVAGQPIALTYTVRQHGHTPMAGLRGSIEASGATRTVTGSVSPAVVTGYAARITLPTPGEWAITIRSGFGRSDVTLLPLTVVAAGSRRTTPIRDADRGRQLFVAKGCVTCHEQIDVGPRLNGKRFDVASISRFLASPPATPSRPGQFAMPNLGLRSPEIASLVTYLNSERRVSQRP